MRHQVEKMIRTIGTIGVAFSLIVGSALTVYSAEEMNGDSIGQEIYNEGSSGENTGEAADQDDAGKSDSNASEGGSEEESENALLPVADLSGEQSSLAVHLIYVDEEQKKNVPVVGAQIELFKVADLTTDNGVAKYTLTEEFVSSGIDFEGMTASESMTAAEELNKLIDETGIEPLKIQSSDEQGIIQYTELNPGMYLGRQREPVQISDTKKITIEPVLWMAPMYELSESQNMYVWNYAPQVLPKSGEVEKIPTPTPTFTPTPTVTTTPTKTTKGWNTEI